MDIIAQGFLAFSKIYIIAPIVLIGLAFFNRNIFFNALFVLLFSMIVTASLKEVFKIPLSTALHKVGYAFPSSHMNAAIVFYGWLFMFVKNNLVRTGLLIIIVGIAWGLMHFGYHNWQDIAGAVGFGGTIIHIYRYCQKRIMHTNLLMLALAVVMMIFLKTQNNIPQHIWMAFSLLVGLELLSQGALLFKAKHKKIWGRHTNR